MAGGSKKAVVYAIGGNGFVTVLKFLAAFSTASASMMNEAVHSLMDTVNQIFLLLGIRQSERPADGLYAFGHGQKKYLWNLWSAIGLFSIGAGLGLAHAWHSWHNLHEVKIGGLVSLFGMQVSSLWVSGVVLTIALIVEGYVLMIAGREFAARMREEGETNPFKFIIEGDDPTLTAVVLEDSVAVLGVILAGTGITLSFLTQNAIWDVLFSVLIAVMLAVIAFVLGAVNMRLLTDVRDVDAEAAFAKVADEHREVEKYHDLRSVVVDEAHTVVVAEIELREEALMQGLAERVKRHEAALFKNIPDERRGDTAVKEYVTRRAAVQSTLERTEEIIDELEGRVRKLAPQISHITIEVEGIAEDPGFDFDTLSSSNT